MRHARPAFSLYNFLISIKLRIAVFLKTAKVFTLRTRKVSVLSGYTICFVTYTTVAAVVALACVQPPLPSKKSERSVCDLPLIIVFKDHVTFSGMCGK